MEKSPFNQLIAEQPKSSQEDYVQQFMKANTQKQGLGFQAAGTNDPLVGQAERIKILKQDRKNKKKGKKFIKV